MKKLLIAAVLLLLTAALVCSASGECLLAELVERIGSAENPAVYTLACLDYGVMEPTEDFEPEFTDTLLSASLVPVGLEERPDGEYLVLNFPEENVRFDFYYGDENYICQTGPDGSEELFRAEMGEDELVTPYMVISAAEDDLASLLGLLE